MSKFNVRLFFAGDFCSKPTTSLITVEDKLKELIHSCDIGVINFEVPLKPDGMMPYKGRYEQYYQNDDTPPFLRGLGFNLFSTANNHTFDWGVKGFHKTQAMLGIDSCFGAGLYEDAYNLKIVEVNDYKLGFMSLTYAAYYGVFDDVLHRDGYGCAYINDLRVNHDILEAKGKVDFLFILPHDGIEYIDVPLPETIARYRDFIDYGADAVIGTHPHCPQGWEEYNGKPIFYSLGNFFFNSKEDPSYRANNRPHWYEGICVLIRINELGINYEVINTKNVDNTFIGLDNNPERTAHNNRICEYIKNKEAYMACLTSGISSLAEEQELSIIDNTIHKRNLFSVIKTIIRKTLRILTNRDYDDNNALKNLMKNDTRRMGLLRYLNNNSKMNN